MTTPLQLWFSLDRKVDRQKKAMSDDVVSEKRENCVDAGIPLSVTMHPYAIRDAIEVSAC